MQNVLSFKRKIIESRQVKLTEDELIIKSIDGDCDAFGELLKLNKEYLYKMAYVYVKDSDKALDIMQECTYKAFKNIKTLREPKYFKTWITRILINIAVKSLKDDSKTLYLDDSNPLINENTSINVEEKLDLYNAIEVLKPDYRNVIIMKYFNDMTVDDISSLTNIPVNTVKTRLSRARKALKYILKEEYLND